MKAFDALARLRTGNARFVNNVRSLEALASQGRRAELIEGQAPFAIVLCCSDSRSPAEIVFDQGLGDLFVIRVAGNIVAPSQVGSVEFAAERFGTRLVVVMGHTLCGAIAAAIDTARADAPHSSNLMSIVDRVRAAIEPLMETDAANNPERLNALAVRANVRASTHHLRHGSPVLERLILEEDLVVVGAVYDLASGVVEFFDGAPAS